MRKLCLCLFAAFFLASFLGGSSDALALKKVSRAWKHMTGKSKYKPSRFYETEMDTLKESPAAAGVGDWRSFRDTLFPDGYAPEGRLLGGGSGGSKPVNQGTQMQPLGNNALPANNPHPAGGGGGGTRQSWIKRHPNLALAGVITGGVAGVIGTIAAVVGIPLGIVCGDQKLCGNDDSSDGFDVSVTTLGAEDVTTTSAQLQGTIDPKDEEGLQYFFEYGPVDNPGQFRSPEVTLSSGDLQNVSAKVAGLQSESGYTFKLVVAGSGGNRRAGQSKAFTTQVETVSVTTDVATNVEATTADFAGTVNTGVVTNVSYYFEYWPTEDPSSVQRTQQLPLGGAGAQPVSAPQVPGLTAETEYTVQLVAVDGSNVNSGNTQQLITLPYLAQLAGTQGCISDIGAFGCQDGVALDNVRSVVVSPDGENAYAAVELSNAVVVFDRNTTTGELTQKAGTAGCISSDPAYKVYDAVTNPNPCMPGKGLGGARSVVVSPDGKNVYATGQDSSSVVMLDRDPVTGALTQRVGTQACISSDSNVVAGAGCRLGRALNFALSVTVSGDNKNVYTGAEGDDSVAVFNRAL